MAPSQAKPAVSPVSPMPKARSATTATWLAMSTFLPRPAMNRAQPAAKSSQLSCRWSICSATVSYLTMGPAMSWGKKEMYSPTFRGDFCTWPRSRWTSST